uniref:NADH-ubiquinone oxidoreductase chain 6 n=1 Tax=Eucinetus haemorrhoidalis TaxID=1490181 RepID=A0A343A4B5_9COLE|nr:NADH dehydrogenase subunit 6 [Eucinetus haemorrhoidalis]AOY39393.1 NADH dehydrogenase subunit 6 [Eucinetus haemorrhoidalis]
MMSLNFMMSILMIFMNHPMSMGANLLIQTIIIALITSMFYYNYWFSFIIFMIMVGGMLILFIYMTSIASNELFKYNFKMISIMIILTLMFTFFMKTMETYNFYMNFLNSDSNMMNNISFMINENFMSLSKIFNYPNNKISILLINYLLLTLIITVKITNMKKGPLRKTN